MHITMSGGGLPLAATLYNMAKSIKRLLSQHIFVFFWSEVVFHGLPLDLPLSQGNLNATSQNNLVHSNPSVRCLLSDSGTSM